MTTGTATTTTPDPVTTTIETEKQMTSQLLGQAAAEVRAAPPSRLAFALASRLLLFAAAQGAVAGVLAGAGAADPWAQAAAWWPLSATAVNLVSIVLLRRWLRADGAGLRHLFRPFQAGWKGDVWRAAVITATGGAIAALTNLVLASWLFGDPQAGYTALVQPLPVWAAALALVLFPVTTALAELPTYYGYIQPRLARAGFTGAAVLLLPALFHAAQHMTLPLQYDGAFLLWRGLMFLPFALILSWALRRRPTLLPYLVAVHFLLDLQAALAVLTVAV